MFSGSSYNEWIQEIYIDVGILIKSNEFRVDILTKDVKPEKLISFIMLSNC